MHFGLFNLWFENALWYAYTFMLSKFLHHDISSSLMCLNGKHNVLSQRNKSENLNHRVFWEQDITVYFHQLSSVTRPGEPGSLYTVTSWGCGVSFWEIIHVVSS